MKTLVSNTQCWLAAIYCCFFVSMNAQVIETLKDSHKPETDLHPEIFWDLKAYSPDTELLKVIGVANDGTIYEVKAIQYAEDTSLLDVKVFVNGERLPVKLILNNKEDLFPLKGIDKTGNLIAIKAVTDKGDYLDIKGMGKTGNTITIKAMAQNGNTFSLLAMAPDGMVNTIKGLKMTSQSLESVINGIDIYAHVKAMCDIEDKL